MGLGLGLVCLFGFSSSVAILSKAAQVQPDGFAKKNLIFNFFVARWRVGPQTFSTGRSVEFSNPRR